MHLEEIKFNGKTLSSYNTETAFVLNTRKVLSMFIHPSSAGNYFISWDKCTPEPQPLLTWRSVMTLPLTLTAAETEQHLISLKTSHLN